MSSANDETPATGGEAKPEPQNPWEAAGKATRNLSARPGVKFILIGFITIALLIPAMLVWGLVEERSSRAERVAQSISEGWGGSQTINGPYLVVPYRISEKVNKKMVQVTRHAIISPEALSLDGDINVEERRKSIFKTQLYHLKTKVKGQFDIAYLDEVKARGGFILPDAAFIALGVSDMTGFRSDVMISIDGTKAVNAKPGLNGIGNHTPYEVNDRSYRNQPASRLIGGVHLPLERGFLEKPFTFAIELALNGSRSLSVIPAGKTTSYALKSNWPHPGFDGKFLPESRDITEDGFTAKWTVPNLARGIDGVHLGKVLPGNAVAMQVNFVEPLQFYQVVSRTLKFSIGIFSLVFLAIFVMELTGRNPVHWIQYVLVGLALVVFYVLLLALAEQVGFTIAYLLSALSTIALIAWYVGDALKGKYSTAVIATVMGLTYLVMYLILNEEDYALLAGAIVAFAAIATTMVATRSVDWTGRKTATA